MLTVTQRCPTCGHRTAVDRTCGTCAPSAGSVSVELARVAAWVTGPVALLAVVLELL